MSFLESPRFPEEVSAWALGGPVFNTIIAQAGGGAESRNIVWSYPLGRWDVSAGLRETKNAIATVAYFRNVFGRAYGFRMQDPFDNAADDTTGLLELGVGTGLPSYQLYKAYTVGSSTAARKIVKPVVGGLAVKRATVLAVQGAGAGNYACDYTTGIVTFVADESHAVSAVAVGATTQVTLSAAITGLAIGGKLYLSGLTGADAALLNGKAHSVSGVAGAVYTLATNTAGKTITAAGTGAKYPQPGETLTWSGAFDVPVRFDNDWLNLQRDDSGGLLQFNNIILKELRL